jgi:hypothetical protein
MSHRSLEQLQTTETNLLERLKAVRAEIRERKATQVSRLARTYAKTIQAAIEGNGGKVPSPEQLAAMLAPKAAAKKPAAKKPKPKAKAAEA